MARNKEQLNKLLIFLEQLIKDTGNKWFADKVRNMIQKEKRINYDNDDKIDDIYELCIENVISKQAKLFYKDFPIKEIVPQLEEDFIKMEHWRRKNNINEFCLALWQQIECINNTISTDSSLADSVQKMMTQPAYLELEKEKKSKSLKDRDIKNRSHRKNAKGETYQIANLLFGSKETLLDKSKCPLQQQSAMDKMACILYFVCYQTVMVSSEYNEFRNIKDSIWDIYQMRNTNHRGTVWEQKQKERIEGIEKNNSMYYFKFMGVFASFVEKIIAGYPELERIKKYFENISCSSPP